MKNVIFLLLFTLTFSLNAQEYRGAAASYFEKDADAIRFNNSNPIPEFVRFKNNTSMSYDRFFSWLKSKYQIDNSIQFKEQQKFTDKLRYTHIKYVQLYNNIPLQNRTLTLHIKDNLVTSFNADIESKVILKVNNQSLTENEALNFALKFVNAEKYIWQQESDYKTDKTISSFYPKAEAILVKNNDLTYSQAYRFDIYATQPLKREEVFVDANDGSILQSNNQIAYTDVVGTANTKYSGTRNITTDSFNNEYRLRESGRGNGIETYNLKKGTVLANAVDFTDKNNIWDTTNIEKDEIATDVHWGAEMTYDYLKNRFDRNSIDGNGYLLKSYVHYGVDYANAYWDGERMIFGDGNSQTNPIVALDIIGHEITHGLTSFSADLNLTNESGALNEGFSDIFGTCIEFYAKPSTANWTLGEDVGFVARDISNPNSKNYPDTYHGTNWVANSTTPAQANDWGGIHTNSTVFGHWFYLLSQGGSGTNDLSNAYNVTGIGIEKAEQIAFRMLTVYLNSNSNFNDARYYAIQSAIDLFGACSAEVESTTNAMYAIGVGNAYNSEVLADFSCDYTTFCRIPMKVEFTNHSTNGESFLWNFGDGETSTDMNPVHEYTNFGTYTVKLYTYAGTCGNDTIEKTDYISILPDNPCSEKMLSNKDQILNGCNGVLYDEGGTKNYNDYTYGITTIAPVGASKITITFDEFAYESGKDFLKIYDGNSTASPIKGNYTGTSLPNGGTIVCNSGAVTLEHTSDAAVNYSGFRLNWQCEASTNKPIAAFYISDSTTCNGTIKFTDKSLNGPSGWIWNFGDGSTSNEQNPTHTYSNNGTYSVQLIAYNSIGQDTLTIENLIKFEQSAVNSITDSSRCDAGTLTLKAEGNGTIKWFENENDTIPVYTGNTFTTNALDTTTVFYVSNTILPESKYATPKSNSFGTGGYYNQAKAHYLIFNSYKQQILKSVKVYAATAGPRTIYLKTMSGAILASKTVNIPANESRVILDFELPEANGLRLEGPFYPNLYRNSTGATYPYTYPGVLSITGSSATDVAVYYYFYDWEIQNIACESPRQPVSAWIYEKPDASFSYLQNGEDIEFTNTTKGGYTDSYWQFGDGSVSTENNPTYSYNSSGQYNVTLIVSNNCKSDTIIQTVNVINSVTDVNAAPIIKIQPNPAKEYFEVIINDRNIENYRMEMKDVLGKIIYSNNNLKPINMINTDGLKKGLYFIKILNSKETLTYKITII